MTGHGSPKSDRCQEILASQLGLKEEKKSLLSISLSTLGLLH
jgi:hypothetical protein